MLTFVRTRLRSAILLSCASFVLIGALPAPVAADTTVTTTQAAQIVSIAKTKLGDKWVFAATGPNTFDCSGLVTYVYRTAGLLDAIGSKRRTVAGFHNWFRNRGLANLNNPQPGDLVVWGRDEHIGIYVGDGKAISALIKPYGVTLHAVTGYIHMKLTAYLHVDITR